MDIRTVCFTKNGYALAKSLKKRALDHSFIINYKEIPGKEFCRLAFLEGTPLIFIGACGIAVRMIADLIEDKLKDIPVLVIDELGQFVIPILSGHVGGANELAAEIADIMGALPVITTATDINGAFSVDTFGVKNGLRILNKEGIKNVSAKALKGYGISILTPKDMLPADVEIIEKDESIGDKALLYLSPKDHVLGIGCKKDKSSEDIEEAVQRALKGADISMEDIAMIASIDIKRDEPGLKAFSAKYHIPFITYSKKQLLSAPGVYEESDFVADTTGVGNVCERAARLAAGEKGEIVLKKQARDGVTVAVAKRDRRLHFG